ncbi:hypothetical protein UFOVP696_8 [uncultured Caudovirales phage]|uniref:Uncharacterized protein n=1 Tax=uncultured Caudovirales phage TaxID=2100421 RepID=A0A6J5MJR8_9CAUD|nr:hypothetical protein UFOVP429_5 [uncultured Caudovirales phage]CAB4158109.1 hypothetical protein UFOVP696_8 [uncultured Caudovirales phage]
MSITSAKTGATGISLALENNFMEPIASVLVGAGQTSIVEFLDIPQNYKHLQLRTIAQITNTSGFGGSGGFGIRYNSDTSTNYTRHFLGGNGSGVNIVNTPNVGGGAIERFPYDQSNTNIPGIAITDILDYASFSKFKTTKNLGGIELNSASTDAQAVLNSFLWRSTDPISSITLSTAPFFFKQHSRFSLYGIKG